MFQKALLSGLSTAAMSVVLASPVAAQNMQSGNCSPMSASGTVTVNGNTCTTTRGASADVNDSSINVTGTTNTVTVTQDGLFNTSNVNIVGDTNQVNHNQSSNFAAAATGISGNNNNSTVRQDGSRQTATISLIGAFNSSFVFQGTGANSSTILTAVKGGNIYSQVQQFSFATTAGALNNSATLDLQNGVTGASGVPRSQQAIINQSENGNVARVVMRGGTISANGGNRAEIQQSNTQFRTNADNTDVVGGAPTVANNPATLNNGDLSISGNGQNVQIFQDGVRNFASASVSRGGVSVTAAGGGVQNGLTFAGNRSEGNQLQVQQIGRNLSAQASVGGNDAAGFNGRGNQGVIYQGLGIGGPGRNQASNPSMQSRDHSSTLFQFGTLSFAQISQDSNVADGGASTNPGGAQSGSVADVSQSAFASSISLTQLGSNIASLNQGAPAADTGINLSGNNTMNVTQVDSGDTPVTGTNPQDPFSPGAPGAFSVARNNVTTSQAGRFNSMTVNQNAVNASATVFQRRGTTSATVVLNQGSAQGFGQAAVPGAAVGASANLVVNVEQSGVQTAGPGVVVRTVAINVRQGGTNLTANVLQNAGVNFSTGTGLSAAVSQIGNRNSASVNQSGSNALATVDQRGGNTVTGSTATNNVSITQTGGVFGAAATGDAGNRAGVRQFATAGRSTAAGGGTTDTPGEGTGSRAGSQSAEAVIIQNANGTALGVASNNDAYIEQSGLGQYAEISQSGRGNTAGISQGAAATNSVAIIRQTGNSNTFFITQDSANQFYRVVQTGGGNQTVTGTGTNGGIGSSGYVPVGGPVAPGAF